MLLGLLGPMLKMASLEAASRVVVGLRPGLPPFAGADPVTPSRRQTGRRLHFAIAGPGFHVVRAFAAVPWLRSCQSACVMAPPGRGSQITICFRVLFGLRQLPSGYGPWHLPVPGRAPIRGDSGVGTKKPAEAGLGWSRRGLFMRLVAAPNSRPRFDGRWRPSMPELLLATCFCARRRRRHEQSRCCRASRSGR